MTQRDDSPWYPSMKIFRRKSLQSWRALAEEVADALSGLVAEKNKKSS